MTHTITVTRVLESPGADTDDPEYTIGGDHDRACQAFWPCEKDWHRHPKNENRELEDWASKRVPELHYWIAGEWMLPIQNRCGLDYAFEYDNPEFQMTELGTFAVDVDWDGDYWLATLVKVGSDV